jgi:hypothetical protein
MILLTPKARKTSCSDVCKSARAGHRRNSGERSKATELGLVGSSGSSRRPLYGVSVSLQEVEAALSFRWQRAVSALAGIARGEADFLTSRAAKLAPNNDEVKKLREEVVKLLERNTDGACKWSFRSRFFWPGAISFAADAASGVLVAPTSSRARRPFSSPPRVG